MRENDDWLWISWAFWNTTTCSTDGWKHSWWACINSTVTWFSSSFGAWSSSWRLKSSFCASMIHACSSSFSNSHTHFKFIDIYICLHITGSPWRGVFNNIFQTNFIDFQDKWISLWLLQSHNEVDNSLLEWFTSWVHAIYTTNFNNKSQSVLSHFRVFMWDPLACKFCQLFIVLTKDHLEWLWL